MNSEPKFEYTIIDSGDYGDISEYSETVISDKSKYDALFTRLKQNQYPIEYPEFNPDKSYIFITFGKQNSGGLDFQLEKVEPKEGKIVVTLHSKSFNGPTISTMAIALPYMVIEINKTLSTELLILKQ
ncbi:protease complex subunit PrcB family protein [Apibacter raozihei]|uniref:protease complex subunit PrcB family protein n=1 Tax=Apibacter raozihei TaxID=2500547 RepID=UPI0013E3E713|nr:protease complex subunit PrcB family protein [Apibacter raozihei]